MQTNDRQLKAVAKAMNASLQRAGYVVPHSTMLHALAAALDKRDWQTLKAATASSPKVASQAATPQPITVYSDRTMFFLRVAMARNAKVWPVPSQDSEALQAALTAALGSVSGVLRWQGWNVPATLTYSTSAVDAGDFKPADSTPARMDIRFDFGFNVSFEVGFTATQGWYVTSTGSREFYEQMEREFSLETVLRAPPATQALTQQADSTEFAGAKFWTDDRCRLVQFDARPFFRAASDRELAAIMEVGFGDDPATDAVASWVAEQGLNKDLVRAFAYLEVQQQNAAVRDPIGFECQVDRAGYLHWMRNQRPQLLAQLLCERAGVELVEAQEEEIEGMWDWLLRDCGMACDQSFDTRQEAESDACERLGLFQKALDGKL